MYYYLDNLKPKYIDANDDFDNNNSMNEICEEVDEHKFLETINIVTVPQSHIDEMIAKVKNFIKLIKTFFLPRPSVGGIAAKPCIVKG